MLAVVEKSLLHEVAVVEFGGVTMSGHTCTHLFCRPQFVTENLLSACTLHFKATE